MSWWLADKERWQRELLEMGEWFPDWRYYEAAAGPEPALIWEGSIQPLPDDAEEAIRILADVAADRKVIVHRGGRLSHDLKCAERHAVHPAAHRESYGTVFHLRVDHRAPPAHPKVFSADPLLGPDLYYTQRHVNQDGSLCPFFAPYGEWSGRKHTLAAYLRRGVAILLAKHLYWLWTRDATGTGIWPGRSGPHGRREVVHESRRLPPTHQCWCGSGKAYQDCHAGDDRPWRE